MPRANTRIKRWLIRMICFVMSGILFLQEVPAVEIENDLLKERIFDLLEKIPQSAGNMYLGPLEVHPSFSITGAYDDNVFNSASRRSMPHHDFYVTYKPKISLLLPARNHSFAFDYGFDIFDYQRTYKTHATEQDHVNRYWGGSANFNLANGFSIRLSDRVNTTTRPGRFIQRTNPLIIDPLDPVVEGQEEQETLEALGNGFTTFVARRTWTNNVASVDINLPDFFDKIDFSLGYSNTDISYKEFRQRGQDMNSNLLKGIVNIKPLPKIDITTGFVYTHIRWENRQGSNSGLKRVPFNIIWQFTDKSHFFLNSAYNWRNYGSGIYADFHGYDAVLGYRFNVTERDSLTIKFERSLKEQQFQTKNIIDFSTIPTSIISTGDGRNNPYHWTQIGIDYTHQFPGNLSVSFSPGWQQVRFRDRQPSFGEDGTLINKHQTIDTIRMEILGRYTAPNGWLFGEVSYNYQDRDSNFPNGDLVKNVGAVSMGLSF
ncbi:MAG: hypothetical protein MRK02_14895 [Candidatus Scalindua sp.]|nr:hypothetical protein [Candidatus Scalindua sp.]